jgi:PAS domain S-box-containing protein
MSRWIRDIVLCLILAAVYLAAGKLGLSLAYVNASTTAVWPPTGVVLAALLLGGYRLWPGVLLGAFLANLAVAGQIANDLLVAAGNTAEGLLGAWLVTRFAGGALFPQRVNSVVKFALLAGFIATAVSATVGATSLCLFNEARWPEYGKIWSTWWLGDMMSNLIIAPLLIVWSGFPRWTAARRWEALLCLAATVTINLLVLSPQLSFEAGQFKYMAFLPILWAAFRFGPHGAITGAFVTATVALWVTLQNAGPFVGPNPNLSLLLLQVFSGALTLTGLVVAAIVCERLAAEEHLEHALTATSESEERERVRAAELQTIMQAVPAVIWIAEDPECQVIKGNPASYEVLRQPQDANLSKSAMAKTGPNNFEVLSKGEPLRAEELPVQRAARGEEIRDFEEEVRFSDGTARYLLGNATALRDAEGRITGAVAAFVDITDRKKAEQALQAREAELGLIMNRTPFMFTRCSRELRYRFVSRAYAEMLGRSPNEITGQPILEIMGEEGFATIQPHIQKVLEGTPAGYESVVHFRGVGTRFLNVVYMPEGDDRGNVTGWIASILDVTDRKAAEAALLDAQTKLAQHAADLEKTVAERTARLRETVHELQTLSYSIAHDMRGPLRAMGAFAEILLEESSALSPEGQDYCARITKGAARLDGLIQDALNYTKTVLQELPLEPVDLGSLLRGLVDTYPNLHPENAQIEIASDLPTVLGNEALLVQCFANLLGNAVKFVPRGQKPHIRVWADGSEAHCVISVRDNGIGIAKEHQTRLFGMFQKLDPSYEGTGIGLAIVRKVVERMHGEVGVESDFGSGSRFWVKLPLVPFTSNATKT